MRYVLLVAMVAALVGCGEGQVSPTPITINNTLTNNNAPPDVGLPTAPPDVSNNLVNLDPDSITVEEDRRTAVTVTVTTPSGNVVATGNIEATILDPSIVMLSEVIGDRAFFRGVNEGETDVIIHAGGSSAQLHVIVVPQS